MALGENIGGLMISSAVVLTTLVLLIYFVRVGK